MRLVLAFIAAVIGLAFFPGAAAADDDKTVLQKALGNNAPAIVSAAGPNGASAATADRTVVCAAYLTKNQVTNLAIMAEMGVYKISKSGAVKLPDYIVKDGGWCHTTKSPNKKCLFLFGDEKHLYGDLRKCE